ncbi:MAG: cobalamin-dependent protein [Planctomycetes bacterium]|nr:cobalamin-dependent protein [Planctomycetota bacterium]MCW8135982.1 cobalamin-dependent protein [Planctomycetota bacterium]
MQTTLTRATAHPLHPLAGNAKVLLSSVFGPYARDDEYGSRLINPMELYHNQVTRVQGPWSLRIFHRSWGLMLIQCNLDAHCNLLDFPTLERFEAEIANNHYDVVGISSILVNIGKVKHMCELVRKHLPDAQIVVGGHIANHPDLHARIDADHIVQGEGIEWFRRYLGEDPQRPIRHPVVHTPVNMRSMGIRVPNKPGSTAATLIPSVGCPMGCNFCSTSAMFGGKGKSRVFYETAEELYSVLCGLEGKAQARSFFVMDENFLLQRKRALRLLELMERDNKPWSYYIFTSANVLRGYSIDELVRLGVSWIWLGLEGKDSRYNKLRGTDTRAMVAEFQANGIRVLGSSIIGLEDHTPANIDDAIDHAVSHATDFHQFMLYTPLPGTPLHRQITQEGRMLPESECDLPEIHGQHRFNFVHPGIPAGMETEMLLRAFTRDFEINGPSLLRIVRTTLKGWLKHRQHPDARVRERFRWEASELPTTWAAVMAAADSHFRGSALHPDIRLLRKELEATFGLKARLVGLLGGWWVRRNLKAEQRRLAAGVTWEPPTFYETNRQSPDGPDMCSWVAPVTQ